MRTGLTPQGMTPFDAQRVARNRVPKRYPLLGFGIIGVYFVLTIVVTLMRSGLDLEDQVNDLAPPTPPGFEGVAPRHARPTDGLDEGDLEQRVPPPAFNDEEPRPRK